MNIKEIQDNAPVQDENLHYAMSSDGRVVYYLPEPDIHCDVVWDERNGKWVWYESMMYENRISNNRKIKPVWSWEIFK
jgi:hypothetical protein